MMGGEDEAEIHGQEEAAFLVLPNTVLFAIASSFSFFFVLLDWMVNDLKIIATCDMEPAGLYSDKDSLRWCV